MTPNPFAHLYSYNRWANGRLLEAAAALPGSLLERDLGVSHRSLWATLQHIVWGEWRWLGRWRERPATGLSPLDCSDLAALQTRWAEITRDQQEFLRQLTPTDLERIIGYENPPGTRWEYSLRDMLQHLVNHSTYHRGQVAALLRQLGAVPPATDYLVFLDELAAGSAPTS